MYILYFPVLYCNSSSQETATYQRLVLQQSMPPLALLLVVASLVEEGMVVLLVLVLVVVGLVEARVEARGVLTGGTTNRLPKLPQFTPQLIVTLTKLNMLTTISHKLLILLG